MHSLYIIGMDRTRDGGPVHVARGMRAAQRALNLPDPLAVALKAGQALFTDRVGYIEVATSEDLGALQEAADVLKSHSDDVVDVEIDPVPDVLHALEEQAAERRNDADEAAREAEHTEPVEMEGAGATGDGESTTLSVDMAVGGHIPSVPAAQSALVLLAAAEGKPHRALYTAGLLGRSTQEEEFYIEVQTLILHTFPGLLGGRGPDVSILG